MVDRISQELSSSGQAAGLTTCSKFKAQQSCCNETQSCINQRLGTCCLTCSNETIVMLDIVTIDEKK